MSEGYRKAILLVEKQGNSTLSNNESYKKDLEKLGYDVVTADTGEQAIQIASSGADIDLIIMNVDLGDGTDGIQVAEAILGKRDLPIVFILSSLDAETLDKVERISSYGFVTRNNSAAEWDLSVKMALRLFEAINLSKKELGERKRAEKQLSQLSHEYETVFQGTQDAMFLVEVVEEDTFRYIRNNRSHQEATGISLEEIKGKTPVELVGEELASEITANYTRCIREKGPISYEERLALPSGEKTWYTTLTPIFGDHATYIIGSSTDITEQKAYQERLALSKNRYRALENNTDTITEIMTPEGKIKYISRRVTDILGYTQDEILQMENTLEYIHPEDMAEIEERIQILLTGEEKTVVAECRYKHKNGHWVWLEATGVNMIDNPYINGLFLSTRDITERKQAEQALRKSEARLKAILDYSPLLINEVDLDGRYLLVNPVIEHFFKMPPNQVIGKTFNELLPHETARTFMERIERVKSERAPISVEDNLQTDDGMRYFLSTLFPLKDETGVITSIGSIAHDITERKQTEEALRESEEKLTRLVQNLHSGVVVHAPDTQILLANEQATTLLGLSLDQLMGKTAMDPAWKFIREDGSTLPFDEYPVNHVVITLTPLVDKIAGIIRPKTNDLVWVQIAAYPEFDASGSLIQIVVTFVDITGRKQAEAAIEKSLEEKNVLLSEIHHRVKNNMAAISSLLTLQSEFGEQKKDPEKLLKDLQIRILSMAWVHELVYESKDFAQIQSVKLLQRLADYLKNSYQPDDKEITLQVRTEDIMLDMNNSVPLTLLIAEVLTNAWKHAFTGRKTGHIEVMLNKDNEGFRMIVRDDGVGVADLEKLRQPESFGYTIVHGLAQQLRGELSFSSPAEGGLQVEAWFPDTMTTKVP